MADAGLLQVGRRVLNEPAALVCERVGEQPWTAPVGLDDRTLDYLLSVQGGFEALGDASRTLAALVVLQASGVRVPPDHPALGQSRRDITEAEVMIHSGRPTRRALHAHRHLVACADRLGQAASLLPGHDESGPDGALKLLRAASGHLQAAAGALPGFEVVALAEGCACCAGRPGTRGT